MKRSEKSAMIYISTCIDGGKVSQKMLREMLCLLVWRHEHYDTFKSVFVDRNYRIVLLDGNVSRGFMVN